MSSQSMQGCREELLAAAGCQRGLQPGAGIGRTAIPLLAIPLTRDPLLIGALTSLSFLPWLLFAIPAGALVDRMDRHACPGPSRPRPAGSGQRAAGIRRRGHPSLPRRPDRSFLFAWLVVAPFVSSAAAYLLAAPLILSITGNLRPVREGQADSGPTTVRTEIREGLRWLRGHELLRGLAVIVGLIAATETMASSLLVLYVVDTLGVPESSFGLFLVSAGVGGLLGGLGAPYRSSSGD